jgi:transcriptional regulator with XRE-family HTH domain
MVLEQPAFGQRLKVLRMERGLSQASLAADVISTGYLSRLESGTRPPTKRVIDHLTQRLGVPLSAFQAVAQARPLAQLVAAVSSAPDDDDLAEPLAQALRDGGEADAAVRWQALWLLARIRAGQGRHAEELTSLEELVALSDDLGSPELRARSRVALSRCLRGLGNIDQARTHAAQACSLASALPLPDRADALHALISVEAEAGRLAEASAHADELCQMTEQAGPAMRAAALWAAATVRTRQGESAGALEYLERALAGLDAHQDLMLWMRLRLAAASLYLQVIPPLTDQARAMVDAVAPVLDLVGSDLHKQQLLALRAHLAFEEGRVADAEALCERIDEQTLSLSFRDAIRVRSLRGQLAIRAGRVGEGTRVLEELARQAEGTHNVELAAEIWRALARSLAEAYQAGQPAPGGSGTPLAAAG